MTTMYVDVEALNLRSSPNASPGNQTAILHLGQLVDQIGPSNADGWAKVKATANGATLEGFVSAGFLRAPVSKAREALVEQAIAQWLRFEKGQGQENLQPFASHVGEMWTAIGLNKLDGTDRDVPWSAAAISFMVRRAGAEGGFAKYAGFKFAAAHAKFIHDSIKRRRAADNTSPFWGVQLFEERPQIGDIVCRWRETPRTFADAERQDSYKSHSDIIVRVGANEVQAIGGNVKHSVSLTTYKKTASGFLDDSDNVFALLINKVG